MINQSEYRHFQRAIDCSDKEKYVFKRDKFNFRQERQGIKHFKVFDLQQTELWYFYLYSCRTDPAELTANTENIKIDFSVTSNGSHFEYNNYMLPAYILLFLLWVAMIVKYAIPMGTIFSLKNPNAVKIIVYGGLMFLGAAYLYRSIHLVIFWNNGDGVHLFEVFYVVLKNVGEAIITTMLVAIAWGWTIIHLKPNQYYIIIGVVSGLINIVCLVLSSLADEH